MASGPQPIQDLTTGINAAMVATRDQQGRSLAELAGLNPVLVVFLRHGGCTFCREALDDLARQRSDIEALGTRIALVHMSSDEDAAELFHRYGLGDVARCSDPQRDLYRAFGLERGKLGQLLGPRVWVRGFRACILSGHGAGKVRGDGFQMPGVFLVHQGRIVRSFRHRTSADRPDYLALARPDRKSSP